MRIRHLKRGFIRELKSELGMAWEYIKGNVASAAELRFSFIMQVVGMMVNNLSFLIVWYLFFEAFGNINGWTGREVVGLQGFVAIAYGFTFAFFSGAAELPATVHNGVFDSLLLTPRNLYLRILTLVTRTSALGDILYGLICLIGYAVLAHLSVIQTILLLLMVIPATVILCNFLLITSCIAFFIPDSDDISKNAFEIMFGPSLYPSGVYQGAMRIFFLFILPTIAIAGLPVEAVKDFNFLSILLVWGLAVIWTLLALLVLKQGLKRYESGNLTGARV